MFNSENKVLPSNHINYTQDFGKHLFKHVNVKTIYFLDLSDQNSNYCLYQMTKKFVADPITKKKTPTFTTSIHAEYSPDFYASKEMAIQWANEDPLTRFIFLRNKISKQAKRSNSTKNLMKINLGIFTRGKYKGKHVSEVNDDEYLLNFYINQYNDQLSEFNSSHINILILKKYIEETGFLNNLLNEANEYFADKVNSAVQYLSSSCLGDTILTGRYLNQSPANILHRSKPRHDLRWLALLNQDRILTPETKLIDNQIYCVVSIKPTFSHLKLASPLTATQYMLIHNYAEQLKIDPVKFHFQADLSSLDEMSDREKLVHYMNLKKYLQQ